MAATGSLPVTPSDGNTRVLLVPAIADETAPTVTELTGAGVVDISCYLTVDGLAATLDEAQISIDLLCSRVTRQEPGRVTPSLTFTGVDNTNTDYEDDFNELVDALTYLSIWYVVIRRGLPFEDAIAAGQKVTVLKGKAGMKQLVASEANSFQRSTWNMNAASYNPDVAVVAGS
ncbi:hypothetical protein GCM10025864_39590 [Luteimicrobium album]|uniref:Phage tail protein n=1 Tax=Luteimicrobium album TaxID=1054550 RepID=A0ABQ6I5Z4_9MICO|nr:hypothetical protein [Luteimicrobium album]GMA26200.1 hypothetical protein GCM10025864_39590 [Luteimicrobium album]